MGFWNRFYYGIDENSVKRASEEVAYQIRNISKEAFRKGDIRTRGVIFNGYGYGWNVSYNESNYTYSLYIENEITNDSWNRTFKHHVPEWALYDFFIEICKSYRS